MAKDDMNTTYRKAASEKIQGEKTGSRGKDFNRSGEEDSHLPEELSSRLQKAKKLNQISGSGKIDTNWGEGETHLICYREVNSRIAKTAGLYQRGECRERKKIMRTKKNSARSILGRTGLGRR